MFGWLANWWGGGGLFVGECEEEAADEVGGDVVDDCGEGGEGGHEDDVDDGEDGGDGDDAAEGGGVVDGLGLAELFEDAVDVSEDAEEVEDEPEE